jgi:hypothetical protein
MTPAGNAAGPHVTTVDQADMRAMAATGEVARITSSPASGAAFM